MDGPGIETRWGRDLLVQRGPGAHPVSYTKGTESLSQGVKRPGLGVDHPTPCSAKVKEGVEVYLCLPPPLFIFMEAYRVNVSLPLQYRGMTADRHTSHSILYAVSPLACRNDDFIFFSYLS